MGINGDRQVRRWESGKTPVSGPAQIAIQCLLRHDQSEPADDTPEEMAFAERRYLRDQANATIPCGGGIIRPGTKGVVRVSKPAAPGPQKGHSS